MRERAIGVSRGQMSYVTRQLVAWGVLTRERQLGVLAAWDGLQAATEAAVKWGFVPGVVALAAYQTEVPLWAILSPV